MGGNYPSTTPQTKKHFTVQVIVRQVDKETTPATRGVVGQGQPTVERSVRDIVNVTTSDDNETDAIRKAIRLLQVEMPES